MSVTELKEQVLALPLEERIELAQSLWASLGAPSGAVLDEAAFKEELLRRDQEMSTEPAFAIPHDEVMAEARRRLGC